MLCGLVSSGGRLLLVGDNPFHNISHLSQERARFRVEDPGDPGFAAGLVASAVANGANGFMFSVSESTLAILRRLRERKVDRELGLYAIVPYAFEYVRLAAQSGGIPGLARKFGRDIFGWRNVGAVGLGLKGLLMVDIAALMKTYLSFEISRVKSCMGKGARLDSVLLHQLVTDLALAFGMDWVFRVFVDFLESKRIVPGFNTGNFAFLVHKLDEWGVDLRRVVIAAPFNKVGFQMVPSVRECEEALGMIPEPNVIALSVLAAGYLNPREAFEYIATLRNVRGVAVGVSREKQAIETFGLLRERFE